MRLWFNLRKLLTLFFVGLVLAQFAAVAQMIIRESSDLGILISKDVDSAEGVTLVRRSDWWSDNGFYPYGPIYYRTAHLIDKGIGPLASSMGRDVSAERAAHLSGMCTSLIALFGISFFIAINMYRSLFKVSFATLTISTALLQSRDWADFIFIVHPDLFLALLMTFSVSCILNARVKMGAFFAGIACATKLSVVPMVLVAPVLIWSGNWNVAARKTAWFLLFVLVGYFAIGFPQTSKITEAQSAIQVGLLYVQPADWQSVLGWLRQIGSQIWMPSLAIVFVKVILMTTEMAPEYESRLAISGRLMLMAVAGLAPFLRIKAAFPVSHYTLPIVVIVLFSVVLSIDAALIAIWGGLSRWTRGAVRAAALIGMGASFLGAVPIPGGAREAFDSRMHCRQEAEMVLGRTRRLIELKAHLLVDFYVPLDDANRAKVSLKWGHILRDLSGSPEVFMTKEGFYVRYLSEKPSAYVLADFPARWLGLRDFYRSIHTGKPFTDLQGRVWSRELKTQCGGWEIWTR